MAEGYGSDRPISPTNPGHYRQNGIEVIDLTETLNFNRGNAIKYIARAGKKGGLEKVLEDLSKAEWYIHREIERVRKLNAGNNG